MPQVGGIQIDEAVTQAFIAALEPAKLAASLAAAERLEADRETSLKQWRLGVERASVSDARSFATARDFAAWMGLTPRAQSSGGKERLGAISKRGNRQLRTLLIVGATSIIKLAKRGLKVPLWIRTMLQRRPVKVVSVALANKIARTIWALLVRGGVYQAPAAMLKT